MTIDNGQLTIKDTTFQVLIDWKTQEIAMLTIKKRQFDVTPDSSIVNCQLSIVNSPKGFTLVELLVVITIIGILSSLITVAVGGARRAAKRATIAMEMNQIMAAIEDYKTKYGEYPPNFGFGNEDAVIRHVRKRWPRFNLHGTTNADKYRSLLTAISYYYRGTRRTTLLSMYGYSGLNDSTLFIDNVGTTTASTLTYDSKNISDWVIWLGGFPNEDGLFSGFSADPTAPFGKFVNVGNNTSVINDGKLIGDYTISVTYDELELGQREAVKLELAIGKQVAFARSDNNIVMPYFSNQIRSDLAVPYVYFRAGTEGDSAYSRPVAGSTTDFVHGYYNFNTFFSNDASWSELGVTSPYAKSGNPFQTGTGRVIWCEPSKYQLIHTGLDGKFGSTIQTDDDPESNYKYTVTGSSNTVIVTFFRSLLTDAEKNTIGKDDFDNLTNFSGGNELKTLID